MAKQLCSTVGRDQNEFLPTTESHAHYSRNVCKISIGTLTFTTRC